VKIADDLYVLDGDGGNTSVYLTDEGVILVDVKFERDYSDIIAKVKTLTDKPVKFVFNTHWHGDHTGGNAKFLPTAQIIAQNNAAAHMLEHKAPGVPQVTFSDQITIRLGGKEVIAKHFSRGHTDGDAAVYFPALKVIATGDAFVAGTYTGHIDYKSGGSIREYVQTLNGFLTWDFDSAVPGHGPVSKRADVITARDKFMALNARVGGMVREGASKDAVIKVLLGEFGWNPTGQGIRNDVDGLMAELQH
jgi:glyoxylase-like metal-dependent hydrolase (beta-lactamase superfamily II)